MADIAKFTYSPAALFGNAIVQVLRITADEMTHLRSIMEKLRSMADNDDRWAVMKELDEIIDNIRANCVPQESVQNAAGLYASAKLAIGVLANLSQKTPAPPKAGKGEKIDFLQEDSAPATSAATSASTVNVDSICEAFTALNKMRAECVSLIREAIEKIFKDVKYFKSTVDDTIIDMIDMNIFSYTLPSPLSTVTSTPKQVLDNAPQSWRDKVIATAAPATNGASTTGAPNAVTGVVESVLFGAIDDILVRVMVARHADPTRACIHQDKMGHLVISLPVKTYTRDADGSYSHSKTTTISLPLANVCTDISPDDIGLPENTEVAVHNSYTMPCNPMKCTSVSNCCYMSIAQNHQPAAGKSAPKVTPMTVNVKALTLDRNYQSYFATYAIIDAIMLSVYGPTNGMTQHQAAAMRDGAPVLLPKMATCQANFAPNYRFATDRATMSENSRPRRIYQRQNPNKSDVSGDDQRDNESDEQHGFKRKSRRNRREKPSE